MFTRQQVIDVYESLYDTVFRKLDDDAERVFGERYTEVHKWRIISDVLALPPITSKGRVLEIGPSMTGLIIQELTRATVEALCVDDLNRNFLDRAGIPLHICDISRETPPLARESFDCILFCEVLEHFMVSPQRAIKTILALCAPGGHIFFSVPNFASIQKRVQLCRGENPQDPLSSTVPYYAHLREPVYAEAKRWWEEAGGKIVREGFTNYDSDEPGGFFSKLFWTARFLKIRNWYGLAHIWFPRTRRYFYFMIAK